MRSYYSHPILTAPALCWSPAAYQAHFPTLVPTQYRWIAAPRLPTDPAYWAVLPRILLARCPFCAAPYREPVDCHSLAGWRSDATRWWRVYARLDPRPATLGQVAGGCRHLLALQTHLHLNGTWPTELLQWTERVGDVPYLLPALWTLPGVQASIGSVPICRLEAGTFHPRYVAYVIAYYALTGAATLDGAAASLYFQAPDLGAAGPIPGDAYDLAAAVAAGRLAWLDPADADGALCSAPLAALPYAARRGFYGRYRYIAFPQASDRLPEHRVLWEDPERGCIFRPAMPLPDAGRPRPTDRAARPRPTPAPAFAAYDAAQAATRCQAALQQDHPDCDAMSLDDLIAWIAQPTPPPVATPDPTNPPLNPFWTLAHLRLTIPARRYRAMRQFLDRPDRPFGDPHRRLQAAFRARLPAQVVVSRCPYCGAAACAYRLDLHGFGAWYMDPTVRLMLNGEYLAACPHLFALGTAINDNGVAPDYPARGIGVGRAVPALVYDFLPPDAPSCAVIHSLPVCRVEDAHLVPRHLVYFIGYFAPAPWNSDLPERIAARERAENAGDQEWVGVWFVNWTRPPDHPAATDLAAWVAARRLAWLDPADPLLALRVGPPAAFPYAAIRQVARPGSGA